MSRSYREPIFTDGFKGSRRRQFYKRYSNKIVRQSKEVPDGKAYKKFSDSWNICDYKMFYDSRYNLKPWKVFRK